MFCYEVFSLVPKAQQAFQLAMLYPILAPDHSERIFKKLIMKLYCQINDVEYVYLYNSLIFCLRLPTENIAIKIIYTKPLSHKLSFLAYVPSAPY